MITFNLENGYLEALVRGFRDSMLSNLQCSNLAQCESVEDIKVQLAATDYGNFLANEAPPISTSLMRAKLTDRLVAQLSYIRANSCGLLSRFLEFTTYPYMIDNVILLITAAMQHHDVQTILEKCHPLGLFDGLPALCVAETTQDLYNMVLVDTPLGPYFRERQLASLEWDPSNIEIMRGALSRAYIEDFHRFCQTNLDSASAEHMTKILEFEADRRVITITVNSFGTGLSRETRASLYPAIGKLHPIGAAKLAAAEDYEAVRSILIDYPELKYFVEQPSSTEKSMEELFIEHEVSLYTNSFLSQFNMAIFYSYLKLKEAEVRNIVWIAECIIHGRRELGTKFVEID